MISRRLPFHSHHPHKRTVPLHGTAMFLIVGCLFTLGCAGRNLPYSIAIGNPDPNTTPPGKEQCVLRLDDIVKEMFQQYSSSGWTIRDLQKEFEITLHERTKGPNGVTNCKDSSGQLVAQNDYPPLEEFSKKWLTTYALDATDPDQNLNRFREYLLSSQLVRELAQSPIHPDEDIGRTYDLVEQQRMQQSQWCGSAHSDILEQSPCLKEQSLYHVITTPTDLYEQLLSGVGQVEATGTQRDQRYFVLSYEIPWDGDRTLVRYGVTFYFEQPAQKASVQLRGYDLIYANEATPRPLEELTADGTPKRSEEQSESWQDTYWRFTGRPFSLVIGLKNAAFEVTKMPFSLIAGLAFGRDHYNYPLTNLLAARDALFLEATTQTRGGLEWGIYRLFTEIPLVGQLFQYNFSFDRSEGDKLDPDISRKLFLSRGIYGGHKWGQDTGLWALFAKQSYPTYDVYSPPYRHGTVIDVVWSMFNLSHGPAYSEARYIMDHATREDRLYLAGHSGGVQRSAAASRILSLHNYRVIKAVGIAGPSIGQAFVDPRYPEAFKIYLNTKSGANQDVVSKIGVVAGAFSTLLDYTTIVPLKYIVGNIAFFKRDELYQTFDRIGFTNATIVEVERKPSSRHQTPLRLSFSDRVVFDAYVRNEFSTAFREDLERPGDAHKTDRPNAFEWHR